MNRRGFLGAILAAGIAPYVVRAESLMAVRMPTSGLIVTQWNWVEECGTIKGDIEVGCSGQRIVRVDDMVFYQQGINEPGLFLSPDRFGLMSGIATSEYINL